MKKNIEFVVGAFILTGIVVFALLVIRFGSYDKLRDTYEITAAFNYTEGVIEGAPVRVSGVEVGRVKKLVLTPDKKTKVGIVIDIDKKVILRQNALVTINSLGIMGEKYVEFLPQTPDAEILKPGGWIVGKDPISIATITASINDIVIQLKGIFGDEKTGGKLTEIMDNIAKITGDPNKENIRVSLTNIRQFSDNMNAAAASLKAITAQIQSGEGMLGQLIYKKGNIFDFIFMGLSKPRPAPPEKEYKKRR